MRDEETLILKAKNGNAEAFGILYDAYLPKIYRFIYFRVGNRKEEAEDITHQVFLNAWQNIEKYESRGFPFSSWLYRIATNSVIDFYRTRRVHQDIETVPEEFIAELARVDETLDDTHALRGIMQALTKLEPDQQNVLIMKFVDDLSTKEIATALQKSEGAVRVIQHRALKQLKQHVDETQQYNRFPTQEA